jgi:hypothetical protein
MFERWFVLVLLLIATVGPIEGQQPPDAWRPPLM